MAKAARDGSIEKLQKELDKLPVNDDSMAIADRASLMMKIGRRYVYDGKYSLARETLLDAYKVVEGKTKVQNVMNDDDYARLLEWTGMVKHWTYDLEGAAQCYEACAALEPMNVSFVAAINAICKLGSSARLFSAG
eukprot:scaffold5163_cov78-Cylindrotheca_fusiformis.AAC.1